MMAMGFILRRRDAAAAQDVDAMLAKIWVVAEMPLFTLLGAQVDMRVALGAGAAGLAAITIGLAARTMGVTAALYRSGLNLRDKLFCAIAFTPKATVQATIGGMPLALGMRAGALIVAVAALDVVFTTSFGSAAIPLAAPRLLERDRSAAHRKDGD